MCGRYYYDTFVEKEIRKIVEEISDRIKRKTGDVHPSETAVVITGRNDKLTAEEMKWGFPGYDGKQLLINARCETVNQKRSFSDSVKMRRCVIPARHFYEWDREKNKVTFEHQDQSAMYMAGFYNCVKNEDSYIILTTEANESMSPVHDRMPLILGQDQIRSWILEDDKTGEILKQGSPILNRSQEYEQLNLFGSY